MAQQRKRNPNGAGTITKRKDGRFQAAVYVMQPDGTRARKFAYGKTWTECDTKRRELLAKVDQGVPVPTRSAKLSEWLPYWLENVIRPRRKLSTYDKYEAHVRLYLTPRIGTKRLESLGVADVRRFLARLERETTAATAKETHRVLRSALSAACREELLTRNVASLVEPPRVTSRELSPWTLDETLTFLGAARKDRLYAAFVLAVTMGLRRGEIVGLRWSDVDLENRVLYVRQQTQRRRGQLYQDDPKGRRRRAVPLPAMCVAPLRWHRLRQAAAKQKAGERWQESAYVFTTRTGRPVEPRNVYRSFTPRRRVGRPPRDPAARRPARLRHAPRRSRGRSPRRDGDPRAQPDQHHDGRVHARGAGHPAGGHQPHGPAAQEALALVTAR